MFTTSVYARLNLSVLLPWAGAPISVNKLASEMNLHTPLIDKISPLIEDG
jgi:hypothetical protein